MDHRITDVDPETALATCSVCGPDAPVRFRKHRNHWVCRVPDRRRAPDYLEKQRVYHRERRAQGVRHFRQSNLTASDYDELLKAQEGVCAICQRPETPGRALAVDHCHQTERVRGLLCKRCNLALGLLKDDPERLLRAVQYLNASA